jgi:hypothetical protein
MSVVREHTYFGRQLTSSRRPHASRHAVDLRLASRQHWYLIGYPWTLVVPFHSLVLQAGPPHLQVQFTYFTGLKG